MAKERKCVLGELFLHTKVKEMEDHIRSMLHHCELEKPKGWDCGQECQVCKMKIVSMTDYASHISGSLNKQKVAAAIQMAGNDCNEDYFDQALVDLIYKRKEKKAATAKLAKEEEERNQKEAFQQRLKEGKDHHNKDFCWQKPSHGFGASAHHNWYNRNSGGPVELLWHSNNQGQTATWHAQETHGLQNWSSGEFMNNQECRSNRTWGQGSFPQNSQSRLPWLSSGGSISKFYSRNNISQFDLRGSSMNFSGGSSMGVSWPNFYSQVFNNNNNGRNGQYHQHGAGPKNMNRRSVECDHRPRSYKTSGSNRRPDKTCRWSPYSVTKYPDQVPDNDTTRNFSEKKHDVSRDQHKVKELDSNCCNGQSRLQQKPELATSNWHIIADTRKQQPKLMAKPSDSSSGIGRSSTSSIELLQIPPSHPEKTNKASLKTEWKISSTSDLSAARLGKAFVQSTLKSTGIQSSLKSSLFGPPKQSSPQKQLEKYLKKANQMMLEKRSSLDSSCHNRKETAEVQQKDQSHPGANNINSCLQRLLFSNCKGLEKPTPKSSNCSQNLQSSRVSTSTTKTCEVSGFVDQRSRKKVESQSCLEALDVTIQVVEGGQSSEKEVLKCVEPLVVPRLSRLDLPSTLKHDLTKRRSSKSKAICHEPNLKIVHCVHNLSESCCSDSEKGPVLKPAVRQLTNSSGSQCNVKWQQLSLEFWKKQDKEKGMPRFGIEMVPCEQEYNSLEDDDIPLLDCFQWESLTDGCLQSTSRKRPLSESNLAPAFTASLFSTPQSKDTVREHGAKNQVSARPSNHRPVIQSQIEGRQPEFCPPDTMVLKQPDKTMLWSVKALQKSHAMLRGTSSGMEQLNSQGTAKRRRASVDLSATELSCLEHNNKRKLKYKKECQQINPLLCVSLSEEKLSHSLQVVDTNLIQAKAMLEAAYLEVQCLMVIKQQMTEEMNTLRNKRIEFLQGIQDTVEEESQVKLKQEKLVSLNMESLVPSNGIASYTPPTSSIVTPIKEEPSAVKINSKISSSGWRNSITPELSGAQVYIPESALSCPLSPHNNVELDQSTGSKLADYKEALQEPIESVEGLVKGGKGVVDSRTAKRVRKLKKRKMLKKTLGLEQLENTDTELEEQSLRTRQLQSRRRASRTPQARTIGLLPEDSHMKTPQLNPAQPPSGKMEVTTQSQTSIPGMSRPETQSLACNEVSSTSYLDLCKFSESDMRFTIKLHKNSSETSDHCKDNMPSEGGFEGHQETVNALQIHNGLLYTCSGDRTVKVFNLVSRQCVGVFEGHSSKVSCLLVSASSSLPRHLYSGSSDQTIRCYNLKTRELEQLFSLSDRVLCLHSRWRSLFAGLANGTVVTFNLKTNRQVDVFECHRPRAVSCLASSQEGARRLLLVGSYDSTISVRDARNGLLLRLLEGHSKSVLCMKVVNDLVFSGSSDQCVHKHNIHTGELLRVYKGHSHAVTVVTVMGKVMMTACLDKLVRVYDLQSHEQLQVYSGHTDMVMCMAIHKNMIYTGCYNGSVHAVKLNLMQSFRCWWHGCLLVFGVMDHLQQHLISDHGGSNQLLKCHWKNCEESFGSKQGTLLHMQRHTGEETRV